jgi:hypothetical protein
MAYPLCFYRGRIAWLLSKCKGRQNVCLAARLGDFDRGFRLLGVVKAAARPPHSKRGDVVALAGLSAFAEIWRAVTVESAGLKAAATYACTEKDGDADCVAGA